MAGVGPPPKDPRLRQRQNKTSTRAILAVSPVLGPVGEEKAARAAPELPKRAAEAVPWHPETVAYWSQVWSSPEALQWGPADLGQIVVMFKVLDAFNYGDLSKAAEIRLQAARFGLDVMARRRLQWEREQAPSKPQLPSVRTGTDDPRKVLRRVK